MRRTFQKLFITACLIALAAAGPAFATNGMYLTRLQTSLRLGWWWRADPSETARAATSAGPAPRSSPRPAATSSPP